MRLYLMKINYVTELQVRLRLPICDDNYIIDYSMATGVIILQCTNRFKKTSKKSLLRHPNLRKDWVKWSVQTVVISLNQ